MLHASTVAVRRLNLSSRNSPVPFPSSLSLQLRRPRSVLAIRCCSGVRSEGSNAAEGGSLRVGIGTPIAPLQGYDKTGAADRGFLLLSFVACTTAVAFAGFVIAAVPTLFAIRRTAISLARLADTAADEIPSTMAAVRLSGMELSDLTLELSDLSQEITDGVTKSAQVVQAAEAGIRQIGALARNQTISMIEERANLPEVSLRPVIAGAAKKTSYAVGQAGKTLINFISGSRWSPENDDDKLSDFLGG